MAAGSTHRFLSQLVNGGEVDGVYQVVQCHHRQTPQGNPFLLGEVRDASGALGFVCWNVEFARTAGLSDTGFIRIAGMTEMHKGRLQIVATRVSAVGPDQAASEAFPAPDPVAQRALWTELERLVASCADVWLRRLLSAVFLEDKDLAADFQAAPAGISMHHCWQGGLLQHSVQVALLAEDAARRYPALDHDLLLAGALLHDVAKVEELAWDRGLAYTTRGNLIGHLAAGVLLVERYAAGIEDFPERLREKLQHLILSHHGDEGHGSPREPALLEALVLNALDTLDAQVEAWLRSLRESTSPDPEWTETARMFGRRLYRGP